MSSPAVTLHGFAYGEDVDGVSRRSLGFRLLAPLVPEPWTGEVEALARRLQAAPYPDHWQSLDHFCSVLLNDQQRLIALARYGLTDHTASQRRGGLELVGVVAPAELEVPAVLAIARWLRQRRAGTADLQTFSGTHELAEVLAAAPAAPPTNAPTPVLPVRLGQEGVLLFAAAAPTDPDHHLGLLERNAAPGWQWLPLVGADFPLQTYARRGPLIAWTPQLAGVAFNVERTKAETLQSVSHPLIPFRTLATPALRAMLLLLMVANLWATLTVLRRQSESARAESTASASAPTVVQTTPSPSPGPFAAALHELIVTHSGPRAWDDSQQQLFLRYEQLARVHPRLRIDASDPQGRLAVGMVHVLAQRSSGRLREAVQKALTNRGYDPRLIQAACEAIEQQVTAAEKASP